MTATALTVEAFVASIPPPRFVRVRDAEDQWRVRGRGLVPGREYEVARRDGTKVVVLVERVTKRTPNGEVVAKFTALRPLGTAFFARWAEDDADSCTDFGMGGDWP